MTWLALALLAIGAAVFGATADKPRRPVPPPARPLSFIEQVEAYANQPKEKP